MSTVTLEEAQAHLPELIEHLAPGEELVIMSNAFPVATLVGPMYRLPQPVFGRGQGKLSIVCEDDEHLQGFEDSRLFP